MQRSFLAVFFIFLTVVSISLIVFDHLFDLTDNFRFTIIVGIGTIASGISAIFMSYSAIRTSQFEAIKEYYLNGDTPEMAAYRKKIYDHENKNIPLDEEAASAICSYYHFWGMMVQRRYLPIWIFDSASGPSVCRLYVVMEDYIKEKRTINKMYAHHFQTLVEKIDKKYGYRKDYLQQINLQKK